MVFPVLRRRTSSSAQIRPVSASQGKTYGGARHLLRLILTASFSTQNDYGGRHSKLRIDGVDMAGYWFKSTLAGVGVFDRIATGSWIGQCAAIAPTKRAKTKTAAQKNKESSQ
jgi:hypothetical protein